MKPQHLGKLLPVGDTFVTTTNRMSKDRERSGWNKDFTGPFISYEVLRRGDRRHFMKGKRNYFCEVLAIVEMRTGYWPGSISTPQTHIKITGKRFWQFSYLVKIIEN